jgi:hypothetical protein
MQDRHTMRDREAWTCSYCGQISGKRDGYDHSSGDIKCRLQAYLIGGECPAYLEDIGNNVTTNFALTAKVRTRTDFPAYWRARAEEVRIIAEDFTHEETRDRMMRIAEGYEVMAAHLEPKPEAL